MESPANSFAKKFMNNIERRNKISEFENSVPASFKIVMGISNRKQRLASLSELLEDIDKRINEIQALSAIYKPKTLNEYIGLDEPLSAESINWQKDMADIRRLKDYKIPIVHEINKVKMLLNSRKDPVKTTIEEQYISLYEDTSNVNKVDLLLKSQCYIDTESQWIGKTDFKGELKACFEVLREADIIKPGKATTIYKIIYQRFKYKVNYTSRTLRNNINNPEIIDGFKTLFAPLLRGKR